MDDLIKASDISLQDMINYYLYGKKEKPASAEDYENALRPEATSESFYGKTLLIDAKDFMANGPGKYANISQVPLIQLLFGYADGDRQAYDAFVDKYLGNGKVLTISDLLANGFGESQIQTTVAQYTMDASNDDYITRAYIWSTEKFRLNGDATIQLISGKIVISNLYLRPYNDDFDYISNSRTVQLSNPTSMTVVDPYAIGRAVNIIFENKDTIAPETYGLKNYEADVDRWAVQHDGGLFSAFTSVFLAGNAYLSEFVTGYELADGGKVIYGSSGDNVIDAVNGYYDLLLEQGLGQGKIAWRAIDSDPNITYSHSAISGDNGTVVVSGSGIDTIITGTGNDLIFSGAGEDHAFLNGGIDSVSLGTENDLAEINVSSAEASYSVIDGGDGFDRVRYTIHPSLGDLSGQNLQRQGVTISDFHGTDVDSKPAISVTVSNNMSGRSGTDTLISIEKLELTERADTIVVSTNGLALALNIDMGKSGRVQSELHEGEILDDDAFTVDVDVADYSGVDHGLIYINGSTHDHNPVGAAGAVVQIKGKDQELEAIEDYDADGTLGNNDALHIDGADYVKLTSGDDVVINATIGTIIATGGGNDKIWFTNGIAISDLSALDRITFGSALTLLGGLRDANSEDQRAFGSYGFSYGLNNSGELVISNDFWKVTTVNADGTTSTDAATMYVLNWKDTYLPRTDGMGGTGAGNIFLAEYSITSSRLMDLQNKDLGHASVLGAGVFDIVGLALKTMDGTATYGGEDPLVLDLDGDGLEITPLDYSKAKFDTDDDLYAESTAFVGKDDGVLARDLNHNGKIDGGGELFGRTGLAGFSALASLDGNGDGVIDASDNGLADFDGDGDIDADDTFSDLLIWQDANENHQTDVGELNTVAARGIVSISLPASITAGYSVNGSTVNRTSSFTKVDGSSHLIGEVSLKIENQNTNYIGAPIAVSASVADFADLKGYGTLVSLRQSLSTSSTNEALARTAIGALTDPNLNVLRQAIEPILTAWAAGSPIKINGQVVTGQISAALDDVAVVRDQNQSVVDYTYGFGNEGGSIKHFVGEGNVDSQYDFASGVIISVGGGAGVADGRADVLEAISDWLYNNAASSTVTQGSSLDTQGNSTSFIQYARADGSFVRVYNAGSAAWSSSLVSNSNHVLTSDFSFGLITSAEFGFYERLIGESMDSFFKAPSSTGAGVHAVNTLLAKMDQTLNLFAVRLAVQSGPLSHYFESIQYSADTDGFTSRSGDQLTSVLKALLSDAGTASDPASWLAQWKPFFDVFLSDYSRGNSAQQNTYGFLVQDMLAAVESTASGVTLETFAHSFGIPDNLIVHTNGDVVGTGDADIIIIDGGETSVSGGSGADNYIIGKNFQSVSILDQDAFLAVSVDTLRFSAHNASDIDANRDGADLLLTDKVTGATLRIVNEFEGRWPGAGISDASYDYGVNQIIFADGSLWNKTDIAEAVSKIDDASTTVIGTNDVDVLQGGKGDDLLEGGGDTDIYRYARGDGADVIADVENNAFRNDEDMLQFLGGIRLGDLTFERIGNSHDVKIGIKGEPLDSVTISGQFNATYTGIYGTWYMNRIELITFDNGMSLTADQLAQILLSQYSTSGNDTIYGMDREDFLAGGKGEDFLSGGNQNDTYAFSKGDGHDTIQDGMTNIISGDFDVLQFGATIHASDITFSRLSGSLDSLVLNVGGPDDTVTLSNEFNYTETGILGEIFWDRVEEVRFTDGSGVVWTSEQIAQMALDAESTAGDDHIYGFSTDNVLDGGAGDDILEGRGGDDTYIFGRGYGNDTIIDSVGVSVLAPYYDTLIMKDLNFDDVSVSRTTYTLTFTIKDTGETVTMAEQYVRAWAGGDSWGAVDQFVFKDQTFTFDDFSAMALPLIGTSAGETIQGSEYDEIIDGKGGDDVLLGAGGGDTYIYGLGYGHDTITDGIGYVGFSGYDVVRFNGDVSLGDFTITAVDHNLLFSHHNGQDTLYVTGQFSYDWLKIEEFDFADGTVLTSDDIIQTVTTHTSTAADDAFVGTVLNDTYIYSRGGGNDTVDESTIYSGTADKLILSGINATDVTLVRSGDNVSLVIAESTPGADDGGSILLYSEFFTTYGNGNFDKGVEQVVFADGTIWTAQTMRDKLLTSTAANENFVGFGTDDTYVYVRGGGNDTINETTIYSGSADKLMLVDIDPTDVSLVRNGGDVTLIIAESSPGAGDGGSIVLYGEFSFNFDIGVERISFGDGTVWTPTEILAQVLSGAATSGNDTISGTSADDTLAGGRGDDTLSGGTGSDTYVYSRGDGNDTIIETQYYAGNDQLVFTDINQSDVTLLRNGNDLTLVIRESAPGANDGGSVLLASEFYSTYGNGNFDIGVEKVVFADGTAWSSQTMRDMLLTSTEANENFVGFATDDTYRYSRGGGNDSIDETAIYSGSNDKLILTDLGRDDVRFVLNGADITLDIAPSTFGGTDGGSILLKGELSGNYDIGVERIVFADGVTITQSQIHDQLLTSTSADETLTGFGTSDTYHYSRGDGNDILVDGTWGGDGDRVVLTDINPNDVTVSGVGNDIVIHIKETSAGAGNAGSVTLQNSLNDGWDVGIEFVVFADGTTWSRNTMRAHILADAATDGADTINGFNSDDTIAGGKGNDTLNGNGGWDTYLYSRGDGNDTVNEGAWSGSDTLKFTNINLGEVTFTQNGNDLTVHVAETSAGAGDGGSILLTSSVNDGSEVGVERVAFADGTILNRDQIHSLLLTSTPADETLTGFGGNDTYHYSRGGGNDTLVDGAWSGSGDTAVLDDINPNEVSVTSVGNDIIIHVNESSPDAGDAGSVTLKDSLNDGSDVGIESVRFADGTTWSRATMHLKILAGEATNGDDTITGFNSNDTIAGGRGNDTISGQGGDDTYVYARGDGNDVLADGEFSGTADTLSLTDINPSDVTLTVSGNDLLLSISESHSGAGDAGSVLLLNTRYGSFDAGIERIAFADGTVWARSDFQQQTSSLVGTPGDDFISGTGASETLNGRGGNDRLEGGDGTDTYIYNAGDGDDSILDYGNTRDNRIKFGAGILPSDVIVSKVASDSNDLMLSFSDMSGSILLDNQAWWNAGIEFFEYANGTVWTETDLYAKYVSDQSTSGNDYIVGTTYDDTISGGLGDDRLEGGDGADTYRYNAGDGNDVIFDYSSSRGNRILFGAGIQATDVKFSRVVDDANDVRLSFTSMGGSIVLDNEFWWNAGVESIQFADGTVWSEADIYTKYVADQATSSNDIIVGTPSNDILAGGLGDDLLQGGQGTDTYLYNIGDGNDTILDYQGSRDNRLVFGDGIDVDDLVVSRVASDTNDIKIEFANAPGSILLDNQLWWDAGVESFQFSDGTELSSTDLEAKAWYRGTTGNDSVSGSSGNDTIVGLAGADSLFGGDGDDILIGGAGNDYLEGGNGSDTYKFTFGDGQDIIEDRGSSAASEVDTLLLGTGISASDVTITNAVNGDDLLLAINGSSDSVLLRNQLVSNSGGVDQIAFADGTSWERPTISSHALAA